MNVYISKTSNVLNRQPYQPELITPRVCLNPLYKSVKLDFPCEILLDSAAYQDEVERVSFQKAYERQVDFQKKLGQRAKYIVAYDKIGDRAMSMNANKFLLLGIKLPKGQKPILVVQGATPEEYSHCLRELLSLSLDHDFVIGFGGIAKCGINKAIEQKLYNAITENLQNFGLVKHVHIFGCFTNRVLKTVESALPGIEVSVDTASCEIRSVMGNVFSDGKWVKTFDRSQKYVDYHPASLAYDNILRAISYYEGETIYRYQNLYAGVC